MVIQKLKNIYNLGPGFIFFFHSMCSISSLSLLFFIFCFCWFHYIRFFYICICLSSFFFLLFFGIVIFYHFSNFHSVKYHKLLSRFVVLFSVYKINFTFYPNILVCAMSLRVYIFSYFFFFCFAVFLCVICVCL